MDKAKEQRKNPTFSHSDSVAVIMTSRVTGTAERHRDADASSVSAAIQTGSCRYTSTGSSGNCAPRTRRSDRCSGSSWQRTVATVLLAVVTLSLTAFRPSEAIEWLGLSNDKRQLTWNQTAGADCARTKMLGLIRDQRLICQRNPDLMPAVSQAARDAVDICQELFADRRWNCSSLTLAPTYLPDLSSNSREQAFVQALSSAALVHAISKACSAGLSSKCGCGPIPNDPPPTPPPSGNGVNGQPGSGAGQFKWGGCADDLRFGLVFGKWFTDSPTSNSRKISRRAVINSHNNAVGRKVIADSLSTHCKCHGVSGSCTVKTCYRALPVDLRPTVGAVLKSRYAVAVHVDSRNTVPGSAPAAPPPPPPAAIQMPSSHRKRGTSSFLTTSTPTGTGNGRSKSSRRKSASNGKQQQSTRSRGGGVQGTIEDQSDWTGSHHQQQQQGSSRTGRTAVVQARSPIDRVEAMLTNKSVRDDDLIYYTISPDYCLPDAALGSLGTKDRACDKDSSGSGGCRTMCCGRGYKTETVEVRQRCDCKYYWCCYVKCKTCTKVIEVHRCR